MGKFFKFPSKAHLIYYSERPFVIYFWLNYFQNNKQADSCLCPHGTKCFALGAPLLRTLAHINPSTIHIFKKKMCIDFPRTRSSHSAKYAPGTYHLLSNWFENNFVQGCVDKFIYPMPQICLYHSWIWILEPTISTYHKPNRSATEWIFSEKQRNC